MYLLEFVAKHVDPVVAADCDAAVESHFERRAEPPLPRISSRVENFWKIINPR
jgi:hypothetical protein